MACGVNWLTDIDDDVISLIDPRFHESVLVSYIQFNTSTKFSTYYIKCYINFVPDIIQMYKWLTAYTLKLTYEKVQQLLGEGKDNLQAKNESQSYNAVSLSVVYGEVSALLFIYRIMRFFTCINLLLIDSGYFLKN